jgi:hypothetical protein
VEIKLSQSVQTTCCKIREENQTRFRTLLPSEGGTT